MKLVQMRMELQSKQGAIKLLRSDEMLVERKLARREKNLNELQQALEKEKGKQLVRRILGGLCLHVLYVCCLLAAWHVMRLGPARSLCTGVKHLAAQIMEAPLACLGQHVLADRTLLAQLFQPPARARSRTRKISAATA